MNGKKFKNSNNKTKPNDRIRKTYYAPRTQPPDRTLTKELANLTSITTPSPRGKLGAADDGSPFDAMAGSSDELTLDEAAERARALDDEFEELKLLRDSPIQHSPFMPRLPGQSGRERRRNRQQLAQLAIATCPQRGEGIIRLRLGLCLAVNQRRRLLLTRTLSEIDEIGRIVGAVWSSADVF